MYGDKETTGQAINQIKEYTLAEEKLKSAEYHQEQANKQYKAFHFLRENPAFDQFIKLVRSGAIQF